MFGLRVTPTLFLSTPSARRATDHVLARVNAQCISIHALREEGDGAGLLLSTCKQLFLSTPSARRATRTGSWNFWTATFLSTPSARRATCPYPVIHVFIVFLSTPSARRATDRKIYAVLYRLFLSTPSARRATFALVEIGLVQVQFLSTPSARRATRGHAVPALALGISIHALREEGDASRPSGICSTAYFYPRPPRGGRHRDLRLR